MNVKSQTQSKSTSASFTPTQNTLLQRKCACGNHTLASGDCLECRKKRLRAKAANHNEQEAVPPIVNEVLRSPGRPLDPTSRTFMEPRFGHNFSGVRVHTDPKAAESARAVNAIAYNVGNHIIFGSGQYTPKTAKGGWLLAHELTHVVQQSIGGNAGLRSATAISHPTDPSEVEAEATAERIMNGNSVQVKQPAGAVVQGLSVGEGIAIGAGAVGLGIGIAALVGAFSGSKVGVDSSCNNFCPGLDIEAEVKKADAKTSDPAKDVKFTYQVLGEANTRTFDEKIDFNKVAIKCDSSNTDCGGWSSKGIITLGKSACSSATCGPLASTILHEMVHDWAGWGPPYDTKNVIVPGATHNTPDFLDEWAGRYVEKACFGTDPWGLP